MRDERARADAEGCGIVCSLFACGKNQEVIYETDKKETHAVPVGLCGSAVHEEGSAGGQKEALRTFLLKMNVPVAGTEKLTEEKTGELFADMGKWTYRPGEATWRMKRNMQTLLKRAADIVISGEVKRKD